MGNTQSICPSSLPETPNFLSNPSFENGVPTQNQDGSTSWTPNNWRISQEPETAFIANGSAFDGSYYAEFSNNGDYSGGSIFYAPDSGAAPLIPTDPSNDYLLSYMAALSIPYNTDQPPSFQVVLNDQSTTFYILKADDESNAAFANGATNNSLISSYQRMCFTVPGSWLENANTMQIVAYYGGSLRYLIDSVSLQLIPAPVVDTTETVSVTATSTVTPVEVTTTPTVSAILTSIQTITKSVQTTITPSSIKTINTVDPSCTEVFASFDYNCCPVKSLTLAPSATPNVQQLSGRYSLEERYNYLNMLKERNNDDETVTTTVSTETTTLDAATTTAEPITVTVATDSSITTVTRISTKKASYPRTTQTSCSSVTVARYSCPTNVPSASQRSQLKLNYLNGAKGKASTGKQVHVKCRGKNYLY